MKASLLMFLALATVLIMAGCPSPAGSNTPTRGGSTSQSTGTEYVFTPDTSALSYNPNFFAIAYGNGVHVAVGTSGTVMTCSDGTDWKLTESNPVALATRNTSTGITARARTLARPRFAARSGPIAATVSAARTLVSYSSPNTDISGDLTGIAYGAGVFVALSSIVDPAVAYSSTDGNSWTEIVNENLSLFYQISSIAFLNGAFVAIGDDTVGNSIAETSGNGITWSAPVVLPFASNYEFFGGAAYGNGVYVAVDYNYSGNNVPIVYSPDGSQWSAASITMPPSLDSTTVALASVTFGNGIFVAVGKAHNTMQTPNFDSMLILVSVDGKNWSSQDLPLTGYPPGNYGNNGAINWYLTGVAAGSGGFVAVGNYSYPVVVVGDGTYVAYYPGSIVLTSTTGRSWQYQYYNSLVSSVAAGTNFFGIALGDSYYYSVYY